MRILIAGGGTAGHVFPALALARRLAEQGHDVRFAGTAKGKESSLVPEAGFAFVEVEARPFVRKPSWGALAAPITAARSVGRLRPSVEACDVVVGMGGYVSVPVALAALRGRRPLVLHEQNAVPGLANRVLARGARSIALVFAEAARGLPRRARTVVTGNPVRDAILAVRTDRERLAKDALAAFGLDAARRTVFVFGGSQGALHLNRATVDVVRRLRRQDVQIVLLTGPAHAERIRTELEADGTIPVTTMAFLERMELAYAAADLVVARAGATTVAEVSVCGVPSVLVPYPYATGRHQEANARALQRAGGASVLLDDELSGPVLAERITGLLDDPERLHSMGERAREWSRPDAAQALAGVVLDAGEAV